MEKWSAKRWETNQMKNLRIFNIWINDCGVTSFWKRDFLFDGCGLSEKKNWRNEIHFIVANGCCVSSTHTQKCNQWFNGVRYGLCGGKYVQNTEFFYEISISFPPLSQFSSILQPCAHSNFVCLAIYLLLFHHPRWSSFMNSFPLNCGLFFFILSLVK